MSIVTEYLRDHGLTFEPVPHPRAFTALDEARTLGVDSDIVVKTVVLRTESGYRLAVVPASRRLNMRSVRLATGPTTRLATETEILKDLPGLELGAVPPIGGLVGVPLLVDPEVAMKETIVFAGTQTQSIQMRTSEVLANPEVTIASLVSEHENHDESFDA